MPWKLWAHIFTKSIAVNIKASLGQFFQTHLMPANGEHNSETWKLPWDETVA